MSTRPLCSRLGIDSTLPRSAGDAKWGGEYLKMAPGGQESYFEIDRPVIFFEPPFPAAHRYRCRRRFPSPSSKGAGNCDGDGDGTVARRRVAARPPRHPRKNVTISLATRVTLASPSSGNTGKLSDSRLARSAAGNAPSR